MLQAKDTIYKFPFQERNGASEENNRKIVV